MVKMNKVRGALTVPEAIAQLRAFHQEQLETEQRERGASGDMRPYAYRSQGALEVLDSLEWHTQAA